MRRSSKIEEGMRRLILRRHAKAVRSRPGERDEDRVLEPRGHKDAEKVGAFLTRHDLLPDRVLVSPSARTRETWARAARTCPDAPAPVEDGRLYDASADTILDVIRKNGRKSCTLVVGHNPGMHDLSTLLIASGDIDMRERLRESLPTSGLVVIDFAVDRWSKLHPHSGRLELFVDPRELEASVD